jgi:uncharacterized protein (UPF0332 family)
MRQEFKDCLEQGKIIRFPQGRKLVDKEMNSAWSDLEDAGFGFGHARYKWSTIQAYYAMYHAARALIYSMGYRERNHYCLLVALQALFVDRGVLDTDLAESFRLAMMLRQNADYRSDFSEEGARSVIEKGERLVQRAEEILGKK